MSRKTVYNNITTPEKIAAINEQNKYLLEEFVEYLHSVDRSETTINAYISDLNIAFVYSLEHLKNKSFVDFTKRDIMKFQNYLLRDLGHSASRVRRLKSSLSSLANFIESVLDEEEEFENFRNIINKIPNPVKEEDGVREKLVLTDEEVEGILEKLVEKKKYQQACALALAYASGSRKSELLRFKIEYFTPEFLVYGSLYKTPEKIKTKGRGKAGKQLNRYVLASKFDKYFQLWLEERKRKGIDEDCGALFVTRDHGKYTEATTTTLDSFAKTISKVAGVDFYFHSMRHQFTTAMLKSGLSESLVQGIIGWSSIG